MERSISDIKDDVTDVEIKTFILKVKIVEKLSDYVYRIKDKSGNIQLDVKESKQKDEIEVGSSYKCFSLKRQNGDTVAAHSMSYLLKDKSVVNYLTTEDLIKMKPYSVMSGRLLVKVLKKPFPTEIVTRYGPRKITKVSVADKVIIVYLFV